MNWQRIVQSAPLLRARLARLVEHDARSLSRLLRQRRPSDAQPSSNVDFTRLKRECSRSFNTAHDVARSSHAANNGTVVWALVGGALLAALVVISDARQAVAVCQTDECVAAAGDRLSDADVLKSAGALRADLPNFTLHGARRACVRVAG